jgi:hypothetical protein
MPIRLPDEIRLQGKAPTKSNRKERVFKASRQHELALERREFDTIADDFGSREDRVARIQDLMVPALRPTVDERTKAQIARVNQGFVLAE